MVSFLYFQFQYSSTKTIHQKKHTILTFISLYIKIHHSIFFLVFFSLIFKRLPLYLATLTHTHRLVFPSSCFLILHSISQHVHYKSFIMYSNFGFMEEDTCPASNCFFFVFFWSWRWILVRSTRQKRKELKENGKEWQAHFKSVEQAQQGGTVPVTRLV